MRLLAAILFFLCLPVMLAGCFYESQPTTEEALGTGCSKSTYGLAFMSSSNTSCENPTPPPGEQGSTIPPAQAQKSAAPTGAENTNQ